MSAGMHDHPGLHPHLPGRELDQDQLEFMAVPRSEFRKAWEFVLSHELTDSERSAFWHGVNIQHGADVPPAGERQTWERTMLPGDLGDGRVQKAVIDVDARGVVQIEESVLAQLLLDAGWERTA